MSPSHAATPIQLKIAAGAAFNRVENGLVVAALLLMGVLPLVEVASRYTGTHIPGSTVFVRQLVLWAAFLGAVVAARKGELLSLATREILPKQFRRPAHILTSGVSLLICTVLVYSSVHALAVERALGATLALGIPVWVAQLVMPVGFALIGIRVVARLGSWRARAAAISFLLIPALLAFGPDLRESGAAWLLAAGMLAATVLGAPIFVALAGFSALLMWNNYEPLAAIFVEIYSLATQPILPTIPLYTLAGYILAEGGTPKRLVEVFRAWFGWMPGGVAVAALAVCAFFTSFTGGSGVTILAMGGLLFPMLVREGGSERFTTGLLTSAGSLGMLFPPSLAVILLGVVVGLDIRHLFVSGIVPGIIEILLVSGYVVWLSRGRGTRRVAFDGRRALRAFRYAGWELIIPVVVVGSILTGLAGLVQAAAFTLLYALVLEFGIRGNLSLRKDLLPVAGKAATLIGGVLLILGAARGLTNYLVFAEIPDQMVIWVQSFVTSPLFFLLLLNIFLLLVGCFMDVFSATTVVMPLILPIGVAFGVDPYHLAIIFLANLELGYLTPPVGMNLFLASYRFKQPLPQVYLATLPFLGIRTVSVLLITYVPFLTQSLPRWLGFVG